MIVLFSVFSESDTVLCDLLFAELMLLLSILPSKGSANTQPHG